MSENSSKPFKPQAERLAQVAGPLLADLGWGQTQIASESGEALSQQRVSNWLGKKARVPTRDDCTAFAATLIVGLMRKRGEVPPDAFEVFQRLLHAAGHSLADDYDEQECWNRISRDSSGANKILRVGWFAWGNFAYPKREESAFDDPENFQGPSRAICQRICDLLGLRMMPMRLKVPEMFAKLQNREVDMLAPFIQLPARLFETACSSPLSGFNPGRRSMSVGINILVHTKYKVQLEAASRALQSSGAQSSASQQLNGWFPQLENLPFGSLRCRWAKGGVPDVILPAALNIPNQIQEDSLGDAWENTRKDTGGNLVPAFVADEVTCFRREEETSREFQRILSRPAYRIPVTVGVHRTETKLLAALNACLEILEHDGFLAGLLNPAKLGDVFPDEFQCSLVSEGKCPLAAGSIIDRKPSDHSLTARESGRGKKTQS